MHKLVLSVSLGAIIGAFTGLQLAEWFGSKYSWLWTVVSSLVGGGISFVSVDTKAVIAAFKQEWGKMPRRGKRFLRFIGNTLAVLITIPVLVFQAYSALVGTMLGFVLAIVLVVSLFTWQLPAAETINTIFSLDHRVFITDPGMLLITSFVGVIWTILTFSDDWHTDALGRPAPTRVSIVIRHVLGLLYVNPFVVTVVAAAWFIAMTPVAIYHGIKNIAKVWHAAAWCAGLVKQIIIAVSSDLHLLSMTFGAVGAGAGYLYANTLLGAAIGFTGAALTHYGVRLVTGPVES